MNEKYWNCIKIRMDKYNRINLELDNISQKIKVKENKNNHNH